MLQYVPRTAKRIGGAPRVGEGTSGGERQQVGIQDAMEGGASPLRKYQDLVVGRRGLGPLLLYEAVILLSAWVPGALGLVLRKLLFPLLLGSVGKGVVFGQGVVLRHPHKVRLGDGVTVDDLVVLDAKGTSNRGIDVGRGVFLGRGTILSCKDGDIAIGDHGNFGFHCEVFSGSSVTVGRHGLFAAQAYLVGGGHEFEEAGLAVIDQPRSSRGIVLGDNVWLGTGAKVLDGVRVGSDVVVGANAVVSADLPDGAIAAGVPARVLRFRQGTEPAGSG
ncbi:MAG TPA: acyltransferase [Vicinamibacteria bacterium]|nr:acyltransferase [Vicinamibacteria bacterium]